MTTSIKYCCAISCCQKLRCLKTLRVLRNWGFPSDSLVKNPPTCQCRRRKICGFSPCNGKIPWRKERQPIPVFLPGNFHGQGMGHSPWGCRVGYDWANEHAFTLDILYVSVFYTFVAILLHYFCSLLVSKSNTRLGTGYTYLSILLPVTDLHVCTYIYYTLVFKVCSKFVDFVFGGKQHFYALIRLPPSH